MTYEVCRVIAAELGFPPEDVTPRARLREDLRLDFFDTAELLTSLETAFAVSLPDEALADLQTVADIEQQLRIAGLQRAA